MDTQVAVVHDSGVEEAVKTPDCSASQGTADNKPAKEAIAGPAGPSPISFAMAGVVSFMVAIMVSGAMLVGYDRFVIKKPISIDVKGFVEQQQALYLEGKITDEQLKQRYEALAEVVKKIPANRVVLMGDAVLGGVEKIDIQTITNSK